MNNSDDNQFKAKILVVDDTLDNINLLSTMLTNCGYKVRKALNGQMALMGIQASPPDIILLDINMPEMNGYEVCQKLKADEKNRLIPVIFLSALDDVFDKVKAFAVGGVDYITKPFQFEEVLARVENHLTTRRLQKQLTEQNALLQESAAREREKSQQLEQALLKLQQTQVQLIQSEKMSAIGQLVASMAHEINNPINFIYANLPYVAEYASESLLLLQLYQQAFPQPPFDIQQRREELDLEFLSEDLPKILSSMKVGSERISNIILSLRNFSRLGEAELKMVDIHEGIDSTLMILQHRLNGQPDLPPIKVVKEYGSLPKVECLASQINQVFLNILNNAIDALYSLFICPTAMLPTSNAETKIQTPTITISTDMADLQRVAITIRDNGPGMTEALKNRIFEPFFTTKEVGSGTGLGLSTSYQIIVDSHGGELVCESVLGGTTFTIFLPIQFSKITSTFK